MSRHASFVVAVLAILALALVVVPDGGRAATAAANGSAELVECKRGKQATDRLAVFRGEMAQVEGATLRGEVAGPEGPRAGIDVLAIHGATGQVRRATTGADGLYGRHVAAGVCRADRLTDFGFR